MDAAKLGLCQPLLLVLLIMDTFICRHIYICDAVTVISHFIVFRINVNVLVRLLLLNVVTPVKRSILFVPFSILGNEEMVTRDAGTCGLGLAVQKKGRASVHNSASIHV